MQQEIIKFDDRLQVNITFHFFNRKWFAQTNFFTRPMYLQALAILMLHYCAGLQHCLDLEEANAAAASSEQNNENGENIFDDLATTDSAEKQHPNDADESISEENFMNYYNNNNV